MWSNVVLFWFLFGAILTFWLWFFDVSLDWCLAPLGERFSLLNAIPLCLTSMFVWSYALLHLNHLLSPSASLKQLTLLLTRTPHGTLFSEVVDMMAFPFLLIFLLVTTLSLIFCLSYNRRELTLFSAYVGVIFVAGCVLFSATSTITFFLAYEMFLIPSFLILYRFAKTRRALEAAYLMFFWTQFGAMFLIFGFMFTFFSTSSTSWGELRAYNFSPWEGFFLTLCWFVGFGVKLPIWPFYGWLPKAHVEASTNFSIFLSGVLVKFAFFGLVRCLYTLNLDLVNPHFIPFLAIGLVDASFKLFLQLDLKKIVAYSTVIEMHWLTICIFAGSTPLMLAGWAMLINHALLSANAFLLVDAINRRFKTRLITELGGLNLLCPKLFILSFVNSLLFLGFPGSLTFISEVLFFSFMMDLYPLLAAIFLVFLYLLAPTFFFRSWFNAMFGLSTLTTTTPPTDLTTREFLTIASLEILICYLGLTWQTFLV